MWDEKAYMSAYQQAMQLTKKGRMPKTRRVKRGDTYRDEPVYEPLVHGFRFKWVEMDETTRIKWWNMFKNLKPADLPSMSDLDILKRGSEWIRDHPEEFKAIIQDHTNKVETASLLGNVWLNLSEQQRNEIVELRDFSNSLVPVLRAHGSTIAP